MSLNSKNFGSNFHGYSGHPHHCIIWVHKGDYSTPTLLNRASCDTQVFIWIFQKIFIWLERGDLNFFFQKNSPFQILFLWQKIYLDSPKIYLWSWRFLLFIWTQDKMLFTWKKNAFWKSLWKLHYGFWNNPLPLSTIPSCHVLSANTLP